MRYRVEKCKGSKFYMVVKVRDGRPFTSLQFDSKKKALKYCAGLEEIDFKEYMKMYRKEGTPGTQKEK